MQQDALANTSLGEATRENLWFRAMPLIILPSLLNFELFNCRTFEPIKSNVSHCDHMDWHVK